MLALILPLIIYLYFAVKNMGTAKAYTFRVFSHSLTSYSISEELKYDLPENVKRRAVTAGLIGGLLFFIVAIVLSVCTVKICNKKRRRKQERGECHAETPLPQPPPELRPIAAAAPYLFTYRNWEIKFSAHIYFIHTYMSPAHPNPMQCTKIYNFAYRGARFLFVVASIMVCCTI